MSIPDSYKRALVTGASRGIGAEIARTLAGAGLEVIALSRGAAPEALEGHRSIVPVAADVTDMAQVAAALGDRSIDVLVNNAGALTTLKPLHEQTAEETAETVALNLTAPLQLMQLLLPGMIERGRGHVVSVTSTAAEYVFANTTTYAATKAGLSMAHRVLRFDLAGTNVRFTEVAPGRVETGFYLAAFEGDAARLGHSNFSHRRSLSPEDVAKAVLSAIAAPEGVDVSRLEIVPSDQAPGGHRFPERDATEANKPPMEKP